MFRGALNIWQHLRIYVVIFICVSQKTRLSNQPKAVGKGEERRGDLMRRVLVSRLDRGIHLWSLLFSLMLSFLLGVKYKRFLDLEGQQDLSLAHRSALIHPRSPLCSALDFSDTPSSFLWQTFPLVYSTQVIFPSDLHKSNSFSSSHLSVHAISSERGYPCPPQIKVWPSIAI